MKATMHGQVDLGLDNVQLIYCSHATGFENKSQFEGHLRDILSRSHAYNPLHEITGALMTDGNMFAQVVEGPSAAVRTLYSSIARDKRHAKVLTLQHTLVHVRLFSFWPVALLRVDAVPGVGALDARSTPMELRRASISILKALRPILLR